VVGIEVERAHFRIRKTSHQLSRWPVRPASMATFPQAPLRSRTVGFPESGSDLGLSPKGLPDRGEVQVLAHIHPCRPRFASRARPRFGGAGLPWLCVQEPPPGPPSAQSPFAQLRSCRRRDGLHGPPRRALPPLPRSYGLMRQTKSLPPPTVAPLVDGSWQVAASPCWEMALPDVISANPSPSAWAPTPAVPVVLCPVSSHRATAFPTL